MKRLSFLSIFIITAVLLSSCSVHLGLSKILGGGSSSSSTPKASTTKVATKAAGNPDAVSIVKGKFRPKNLTVKVGTTVTWKNDDTVAQSVTSDTPGTFDSGSLNPGTTYSFTFSTAGTFPYHSTTANGVFGSVVVTP